ncbi:MAG: glycosyltransferase family 2 protein [Chloroflexi bacterium]|nr:glycosyltransferase family 2 protein [Chloroflexota bacterium]
MSSENAARLSDALTAVVVSYNVRPLLDRCLAALGRALDALGEPAAIVVVDNTSRDGSADLIRGRYPSVRLIENARNVGFGAACNQGLALAGDYVLFTNPDLELEPDALPALLDRLRSTPAAALTGPRLRYPDGRPQPSRRRFPTLGSLLVESTPLEWRGPRWKHLERMRCAGDPEVAAPVDWLSGACLLGRTAALRPAGGFDPRYFMYFEEADLCRRLRANGWQTWYEPAAIAVHHGSRSADQDLPAKDRNFFRSKYRFVERHWGRVPAQAMRYAAGALFAGELAIQTARRDRELVRRYGALVRWHFSREE